MNPPEAFAPVIDLAQARAARDVAPLALADTLLLAVKALRVAAALPDGDDRRDDLIWRVGQICGDVLVMVQDELG